MRLPPLCSDRGAIFNIWLSDAESMLTTADCQTTYHKRAHLHNLNYQDSGTNHLSATNCIHAAIFALALTANDF